VSVKNKFVGNSMLLERMKKRINKRPSMIIRLVLLFIFSSKITAAQNVLNSSFLRDYLLDQGYVEIPLKQGSGDYFYIETSFGNHTLYPLLLDTGCGHTSIDPKLMHFFHFEKTGKSRIGGGGGYGEKQQEVKIPILQLDNFNSHNETVYILNQPLLHLELNHQPGLGLLGIDFLRKHSAIIDILNQRLYLQSAQYNPTFKNLSLIIQNVLKKSGYRNIHLMRSPHGLIIINAKINQYKLAQFLLDSGSIILLSSEYVKK
jgi:hypothetical protein